MKFRGMRTGDRDFLDAGDKRIGKIDQLLPVEGDGQRGCGKITSASVEPREELVARDRDEYDMEVNVFRFRRILVIDPIFESFQVFVRTSVLNALHDVILGFGRRNEGSQIATLQHPVEIARPGADLKGRSDRGLVL